jgi:hypothetical protein
MIIIICLFIVTYCAAQCAAVSTTSGAIKEPPQKNELSIYMPTWKGKSPALAKLPPTIRFLGSVMIYLIYAIKKKKMQQFKKTNFDNIVIIIFYGKIALYLILHIPCVSGSRLARWTFWGCILAHRTAGTAALICLKKHKKYQNWM